MKKSNIYNWIKLIRVKHWIKNFLIFLPLFFSLNLLNKSLLFKSIIGFIIFSFSASIIYILNDIKDLENDRKNILKKNRPLASGKITLKCAKVSIIILFIILVFLMYYSYLNVNNLFIFIIPFIYIIINVLYSSYLKNFPIIDVFCLASGFLLRMIYGGVVINVEISKWLYLMVMFASLYLGYGKRRNEMDINGKDGRKVLNLYNKNFLDKNMYVCLTLAIISYSLWCMDFNTISRIGNSNIFWSIPIVIMILQKYSLNIEENSSGDPTEVILSDKILIVMIVIYVLFMIGVLYI